MMTVWHPLFMISAGAALDATAHWGLTCLYASLFAGFNFGTLLANFLGCFIIGILFALFLEFPQLSSQWKLFLITGFLGRNKNVDQNYPTYNCQIAPPITAQRGARGDLVEVKTE